MTKNKKLLISLICLSCVILLVIIYLNKSGQDDELSQISHKNKKSHNQTTTQLDMNESENIIVPKEKILMPAIDYENLKKNKNLKKMMDLRKKNLGIKKSLDMIIKSNETFIISDKKISMRDILEKAFIKEDNVFEEKINDSGDIIPEEIKEYGIYVVKPGDNIWNIHFNILKEFYDHKGIHVSQNADEPIDQETSSGVGKILKFSETMVIIYNLIEQKTTSDINLLEPLSKIVVYNMDEVFSLLCEINYKNIDRLQFDGKTIWIPAKKQ